MDLVVPALRAIISLNANTLDAGGGLLIGLAAAVAYARRGRLPLRPTLDAFAPGLAAFAVAVEVAHLASGSAFGAPAELPWAIELWDARRHPSQVYEIAVALAIFLVIWRLQRNRPFPSFLFLTWMALTSAARLFLEAFRDDSLIVAGSVRQPQLIALLVLLMSLWLMGRRAREKQGQQAIPTARYRPNGVCATLAIRIYYLCTSPPGEG